MTQESDELPPQQPEPLPFLSHPTLQKIIIVLVIVAICLAIASKVMISENGEVTELQLIDATINKLDGRFEITFDNAGNYTVEIDNDAYSYGMSFYTNETRQMKQFQIFGVAEQKVAVTVTDEDNGVWEMIIL